MKTILIIEDELNVRESLVDLLEIEGFRAIAADNGKSGLALAQLEKPDLVLCDISMPELDGFGVLQKLREDPETGGIPFIFLTARTTKIEFRRGMELGADDYLFKPFTVDELLSAIAARLNKQAALIQQLSSPNLAAVLPTISSQDGLLNYFYQELRNPLSTLNLILYWLRQSSSTVLQELTQPEYSKEVSVLQQVYQQCEQLTPESRALLESCQIHRLNSALLSVAL